MSFGWIGGRPISQELAKMFKDSKTIDFTVTGNTVTAESIMIKEAVKVVADEPILFSGLHEIDGYQLLEGDRILVTNQGDSATNGIYVASHGSWVRSNDANSDQNIVPKMEVPVKFGLRYEDTTWQLEANNPIVVGVTLLTWRVSQWADINGKTFDFAINDWLADETSDRYYIDFKHYFNSKSPSVTVYETSISGDPSPITVEEIDIVDNDTVRIWIVDLDIHGIESRFDGYILIEPVG